MKPGLGGKYSQGVKIDPNLEKYPQTCVFGSVPAKDKALCCFGPIFGDGRLNGCGGPFTQISARFQYEKSCP